ncbi:MAG: hypothetical protein DMF60_02875 [Acidobacteria bacterium]|nr:MAG: hypothetical protein DMF60_02875 [Acidobacteriota bacterium]
MNYSLDARRPGIYPVDHPKSAFAVFGLFQCELQFGPDPVALLFGIPFGDLDTAVDADFFCIARILFVPKCDERH